MGICEPSERNSKKEVLKENQATKVSETKILSQPTNTKNIVKECMLISSPFEKVDTLITNVSKSIRKIKIETVLGNKFGTGFLFKFNIDLETFYCLLSNEHVLTNDIILNNMRIYIYYDSEYRVANITLNKNERYIRSFIDMDLDITVVEILEKDNISKEYYLFNYLLDTINYNDLIKNNIYIPQYAKGKELVNAKGIITEINKYQFTHLASTEPGSSGSPIFLDNSVDVIGIHKGSNKDKTENYGDFIKPIINVIKSDINKKRNSGRYMNGKYIWDDGKYYLGEFKNNLPNGKGIKYYSNGNILYEGYFINGKFEGNGKYILKDGEYYIGQFRNGLRNGKGILYYARRFY